MAMSDPIADLLTRIRNGLMKQQPRVDAPASKIKEDICAVLKGEGYIEDYKRTEDGKQGILQVTLKYLSDRKPVMQGLRRVSKPSLRVYVGSEGVRPVRSGLGISILSTPKGVMTGKQARAANVGGEILCEIW
jgi:small subunit ribosomal protein S8